MRRAQRSAGGRPEDAADRSAAAGLAGGDLRCLPARRRPISPSTSIPAATAPSSRTSPSRPTASTWSRPRTTRPSASGTGRPARRSARCAASGRPGNDGKIFAVAVSPDGKTIAAGGYFGAGLGDKPPYGDIRLFDFSTGKVKAVLKAPEYAIYDLAFSPDGDVACGRRPGRVRLCLAARRGRGDRLEAVQQARRGFLAHPAARLRRRRQPAGRRPPPTTASGSGTCRPERKSRCRRRRAAAGFAA